MRRLARPVSFSSTAAYWPASPILSLTRPASRTTSYPAMRACPASGSDRVARMRTAVVLPAPLGPSTPQTVPLGTLRSRPRSAWVSPKALHSPSASTIGPAMTPPLGTLYAVLSARLGHWVLCTQLGEWNGDRCRVREHLDAARAPGPRAHADLQPRAAHRGRGPDRRRRGAGGRDHAADRRRDRRRRDVAVPVRPQSRRPHHAHSRPADGRDRRRGHALRRLARGPDALRPRDAGHVATAPVDRHRASVAPRPRPQPVALDRTSDGRPRLPRRHRRKSFPHGHLERLRRGRRPRRGRLGRGDPPQRTQRVRMDGAKLPTRPATAEERRLSGLHQDRGGGAPGAPEPRGPVPVRLGTRPRLHRRSHPVNHRASDGEPRKATRPRPLTTGRAARPPRRWAAGPPASRVPSLPGRYGLPAFRSRYSGSCQSPPRSSLEWRATRSGTRRRQASAVRE